MKTLMAMTMVAATVTAMMAAMASPALAKSRTHHVVHKSHASVAQRTPAKAGPSKCNNPNAVCVSGIYVGSDPDSFIRLQLEDEFYRHSYDY